MKLVEPAREPPSPSEAGWAGPRRRSSPSRNHPVHRKPAHRSNVGAVAQAWAT